MTANSPHRPATFWLVGPVMLGLAIGLQLMFWAWGTWLVKPIDPAFSAKLTQLGKVYYLPDYDERIYFGGMLVCTLLMGLFHWRWSGLLRNAPSAGVAILIPRMKALLGVAGGLMALRLAMLPEASLSLVAALLGLLYFAVATRAAGKQLELRSTEAVASMTAVG